MPHMAHGISSAPRGGCTAWECTMRGPAERQLELELEAPLMLDQLRTAHADRGHTQVNMYTYVRMSMYGRCLPRYPSQRS